MAPAQSKLDAENKESLSYVLRVALEQVPDIVDRLHIGGGYPTRLAAEMAWMRLVGGFAYHGTFVDHITVGTGNMNLNQTTNTPDGRHAPTAQQNGHTITPTAPDGRDAPTAQQNGHTTTPTAPDGRDAPTAQQNGHTITPTGPDGRDAPTAQQNGHTITPTAPDGRDAPTAQQNGHTIIPAASDGRNAPTAQQNVSTDPPTTTDGHDGPATLEDLDTSRNGPVDQQEAMSGDASSTQGNRISGSINNDDDNVNTGAGVLATPHSTHKKRAIDQNSPTFKESASKKTR